MRRLIAIDDADGGQRHESHDIGRRETRVAQNLELKPDKRLVFAGTDLDVVEGAAEVIADQRGRYVHRDELARVAAKEVDATPTSTRSVASIRSSFHPDLLTPSTVREAKFRAGAFGREARRGLGSMLEGSELADGDSPTHLGSDSVVVEFQAVARNHRDPTSLRAFMHASISQPPAL